jgi:WD40 repeat protein/serine/threonine protein kinase
MANEAADPEVLLNELADEFAARYRRGERPALTEYVQRHPELADDIRELFPALVEMEVVKAAADAPGTEPEITLPPLEHFGDFQILREIGHGGMGVVYEAEQISLGRRVALKLLTQRMLRDGVQKRRFDREAKAAARLHHTNIVPVFGSGEHYGTPYYVMQFIPGLGLDIVSEEIARLDGRPSPQMGRKDVSEVTQSLITGAFQSTADLERNSDSNSRAVENTSGIAMSMTQPGSSTTTSDRHHRKLTYWQGVARIGVQVADALEYAHRQGIVHRDVKPSNLLLDLSGTAWITDFGLAKGDDQDNLTRTGDMLGTLRYMPPEAFEGKSGVRGDVYGLGISLYELLALRPAFDERDRNKLIKAVTTNEPPRLRRVRANIPRDLETIVHKAIDREPGRRYASAAEMAADLQRFLEDEPIKAREISTRERAWRWCRRYPFDASLLALLAFVCLGGFAGVLWQWRSAVTARNFAEAETAKTKLAEERTATTLYYSDIARARLEQEANNTGGAEAILDRCPKDRRGWEWHFLKGLSHSDLFTFKQHTGWVYSVAISPDGRFIASAGGGNPFWNTQGLQSVRPGEVILWDAATGKSVHTLHGHGNIVTCVAFSPDGTKLVTGGPEPEGVPCVWDVATGRELRRIDCKSTVTKGSVLAMIGGHIAWSPDGRRLAIAATTENVVAVCSIDGDPDVFISPGRIQTAPAITENAATQDAISLMPTSQVLFSSDGRRLICKHVFGHLSAGIGIWDSVTGKELSALEGNAATEHGMAISPDGKRLAAPDHRTIKIWDLSTGRLQRTLVGHQDLVNGLAFSPDSRYLASGSSDCTVRVWNVERGHELRRYRGHIEKVLSVAFSPDGDRVVSGGADGVVKVWDVTYHPEFGQLHAHSFFGYSDGLAFSPDDRRLVMVLANKTVVTLDPTTGTILDRRPTRLLSMFAAPAQPACLDKNARWLAGVTMADRTVAGCYDVATGQERVLLRGHSDPISHVTISDDGRFIATGGPRPVRPDLKGEVKVWDAQTGKLLLELAEKGLGINCIALSPAGDQLAVATMNKRMGTEGAATMIRVYSVASGQRIREITIEREAIFAATFDRDGHRLIAVGGDRTVLLWNLVTGEETITDQGPRMAQDVAVSPDGRRLAVAGRTETIILDANTGEEILVLRNGGQRPGNTAGYDPRVRWSHDGRMLAVNCEANQSAVSVWSVAGDVAASADDAANGRRLAAKRRATMGHTEAMRLAVHPEGSVVRNLDLDFIRDAELGSPWEYANRGVGFFAANNEERAKADLKRAADQAPFAGLAYCVCGRDLYERGQLKKAKEYYALGLAATGGECPDLYVPLTLFAFFDDGESYRQFVKGYLAEYIDQSDPLANLDRRFRAPELLREDSGIDPQQLLAISQRLNYEAPTRDYWPHWRHGLALFRAGQFQAASDAFNQERTQKKPKSEPCPPELVQILRALALIRLNQLEAARTALADADQLLNAQPIIEGEPVSGGYLHLTAKLLKREAEVLMKQQPMER